MGTLETNNAALKRWYQRALRMHPETLHINPIFDSINQILRENNTKFLDDSNPIKTILEYHQGYYFLPTFYALCKYLNISTVMMVNHLRGVLDKDLLPLLDRMEQVGEEHTQVIMKDFTLQTIIFCGNNLCERYTRYRDKLKQIVHDSQRAILSVSTLAQMTELLRNLQESHFPIQVLKLPNSLRKANAFIWNCLTESWQEIQGDKEKDCHMNNLWNAICTYLEEYRKSGKYGGPEPEVTQKFSISAVISTITSDINMERKTIQMDRHKWFIRTADGLLDILTGQVGGTVPELFLSDRKLGVEFSRTELVQLYNHSPELEALYHLMTDKSFFLQYLKALLTDRTDDLFDTLYEMIQEKFSNLTNNPYALSMMHFMVHLSKYTAFEHDLLMYLCDVLASIFIATNYERKFFVMKGETSNGKSKLFEILARVFGGYYHCIQSDNLKPGSSSANPTPDLASTLFNCRIVTTEELEGKLNENRVKQITGNSCVTFRNMYESSQGGIPTAKLFTTTNNLPDCRATEAFQDRVVAIPFMSRFVNKAPLTTSEQVRLNRYGKDEYVVERSYIGCFLILLYHLKKYMDIKNGLLHYRDEPPSVVEYTKIYLFNTDVYNQFKTHMDVQENLNTMTTMTDLRSAVRQFLKSTKNNTTPETDLILKFEEEFSEYRRRSDFQLGHYTSILDQTSDTLTLENTSLQEEAEEEGPKRSLSEVEGPAKDTNMDHAEEYYDLKVLKRSNHRLDRLVDFVAHTNGYKLRKFGSPSKLLPGFNNVTPELVREFKNEAYAHLRQIQTNRVEYGYLFNIIDERDGISHAVYIKYEQFPLMEGDVLPEIYAIAHKLAEPNTDMYDATCLYLLIFLALLVNRHSNWATIDYLTNCNSEHPYAMYVNWIPKCKKSFVYSPSPQGCLLITKCSSM
ncbi:SF3 helicase domain-containing protein [Trichonephila clavata]|uniref:SF3 helicase domain-containing protein n=1 Tax=Trichonephila clavata TaxID=2740835 RepID=A0A8X6FEY8_TRICU|nr:SF3 helicase domain-containing protein [Trichonephila clavata]